MSVYVVRYFPCVTGRVTKSTKPTNSNDIYYIKTTTDETWSDY